MAKSKICDFCLDEPKGLFNKPERLADGHSICKHCRKTIESYGLPVKYDIFQLLVIADPRMREMMIGNYLEQHSASETIAKFYPLPKVLLHPAERAINVYDASIRVLTSLIPTTTATQVIADITRKDFSNLDNAPSESGSTVVSGKLYETDAALYFISEHFINCHRLTSMVRDHEDNSAIHVFEKGKNYRYQIEHADLFFMRESLFMKAAAIQDNKNGNLIYLTSDNTMTITPGIYSVPKNILPGIYYVSPIKDDGLHVRDALGRLKECRSGRVRLDEGSMLEVTGEYQLRINDRNETK